MPAMNKKQYEELGKLWIDLGKYLITAIFFGQFFSENVNISFSLLLAAPALAVVLISLGIRLLGAGEDAFDNDTKRKRSKRTPKNKQSKKQQ